MLRNRPWPYRYIVSALIAVALYLCHLFAVGVYGLGLMAFEIWFALSDRPVAVAAARRSKFCAPASRSCRWCRSC